jgi:hypothetical protein
MNAHINYDLAQSVAEITDYNGLSALERDFLHLNGILSSLLDAAQTAIADFSPVFKLIDLAGGPKEELIFGFGIRKARTHAWLHAEELTRGRDATTVHGHLERVSLALGYGIAHPHCALRLGASVARRLESTDVAAITRRLNALSP